jgi:hypothetical protein
MVPLDLQVQADVRYDLSGAQNIPVGREFDRRTGQQRWFFLYICVQIVIAVSPDRGLIFVETR